MLFFLLAICILFGDYHSTNRPVNDFSNTWFLCKPASFEVFGGERTNNVLLVWLDDEGNRLWYESEYAMVQPLKFDISELHPGFYSIRLISEGIYQDGKFIKR